MKSLSKIFAALLISLFMSCSALYAQGVDSNRMNRDIKIMENVLQEMFKTDLITSEKKNASYFSIGGSGDIRGTYLPDYGIIFSIPGAKSRFLRVNKDDEDEDYSYVFEYSDESGSDNEVNEESITLRIKEFLREYGSTIGQLEGNNKIMVIYNQTNRSGGVTFLRTSSVRMMSNKLPIISVVVNKKDLQAYRSGDLNKSELDDRFSVSTVDKDKKEKLDLKVMANIFETALKDLDKKDFRISGSVNYMHLDNFGAIFGLDVIQGINIREVMVGFKEVAANLKEVFDADSARVKSISIDKKRKEDEAKVSENFNTIISDLKTYLVDYGRTLKSVDANQYILVSVHIKGPVDTLPDRVDLQIKKTTLLEMDKGSMSREEALKQISVREY